MIKTSCPSGSAAGRRESKQKQREKPLPELVREALVLAYPPSSGKQCAAEPVGGARRWAPPGKQTRPSPAATPIEAATSSFESKCRNLQNRVYSTPFSSFFVLSFFRNVRAEKSHQILMFLFSPQELLFSPQELNTNIGEEVFLEYVGQPTVQLTSDFNR